MSHLIEQLKELKNIKPRKNWADSQRELLMSQITRQGSVKTQSFFVNSWPLVKSVVPTVMLKFVARPIGVVTLLITLVLSTGIIGVNASRASLPGDFLYSVKLTSEKVKVGFSESGEKKAQAHVAVAEKRISEIEEIVQNETDVDKKREQVKVAAEGLTDEMTKVREELDIAKDKQSNDKQGDLEVVKDIDKATEEISARIDKKKESVLDDKEISKTLADVGDAVDTTSVKAVEVIIDKHVNGDVELSEKELVETIEKKITKAEDKLKDANEDADKVKEDLEVVEAEEPFDSAQGDIATQSEDEAGENIESTEGSDEEVEETVTSTDALTELPGEAEDFLAEAKESLSVGDLTTAIERIRQSNEKTDEVLVVIDEMNETAAKTETVVEVPEESPSEEEVSNDSELEEDNDESFDPAPQEAGQAQGDVAPQSEESIN